MSTFKACLLALACLPLSAPASQDRIGAMGALGSSSSFMDRRAKPREYDKNELRAQVDETQSLFDGLARESRTLDKPAREGLLKTLASEYQLSDAVSYARNALEKAEELLDIQDAIRVQQKKLKDVLGDSAQADKEEQKLLGLQSDLLATVEELRKGLSKQQKDLNEAATRDFRNWIMVSEGLLRQRREDAELRAAQAGPPVEAPALSADGVGLPQPMTPASKP